ncbi:hypothetical protein GALL_281770 [mine drainage metagenome]|uniref:Uncharacterized protein n=1 Tax=mine drainage metagenome TaxID=410659 RepID=A0A1J5R396_9ZZZZ
MTKVGLREHLERVAAVSQNWANDPILPASIRYMSQHLHRLTTGLSRSRHAQPFPTSVRNVESLFCSMCRRLKVRPHECDGQSLECCPLLNKDASKVH